jgi:adenine-specific DNA-methyltransferase
MSIERKTAADAISQSTDIVADNLDKLKQLFPSVFTEGNIDFEAFRELLGDKVETDPEYYRFTWPGKAIAKEEARKPSRGTLRPAKEESVNWDTTENLYIEGDNLEVLKLLQKSYANKVKMIYIDPPYNTGKDFVYKDNYKDNLASYNEKFNRTDDEGNLKSSAAETNQEGSARYHSNWLNMMYPRLTLARNLLLNDGIILVSLDDTEVDNLRKICNEIFGEDNFVANFQWKRKKEISSDSKNVSIQGEFIVCYSKSGDCQLKNEELSKEYINKSYKEPNKEFSKGKWRPVPITVSKGLSGGGYTYKITNPNGTIHEKIWAYPEESYKNLVKESKVYFGKDGSGIPQRVIYSHESKGQPTTNYWDSTASNKEGKKEILSLFDGNNYFDTPKPIKLLNRILKLNTSNSSNDIILDFFSGSATTAHAVMQLNAEDGGNRKHIQVQLPELTNEKSEAYKAGYKNICEIGKERIRLAGKKILEENPELKDKLDVGFKVFKLNESNIKTWETDPEKLDENLFLEDVIKSDRTEEDVLYEILLKYGLDLTLPIQEKQISDQKLYAIGGGALLVYLGGNANTEIAQEIINWAKELEAINPQVVFKDNGFNNSQDKVNTLQVLKSNNITDVWSI